MDVPVRRLSPKYKNLLIYLSRYWTLYLLLLLPITFFIVFRYIPMTYIQIAFKDFRLDRNIWQMSVAKDGPFQYFQQAFKNRDFIYALRNTLMLNGLDLLFGFPAPIVMALLLNELAFKRYKRFTQTVSYMPHFLSWVIIASLSNQLFATTEGLVNIWLRGVGFDPINFLGIPVNWVFTYCFLGVWQNLGWGSIIYLAAMTSINPELYEAAEVDGASRIRKVWHITLPGIRPTMVTLLIMNLGRILGSDFERPFSLRNKLVYSVSNPISIFTYDYGITGMKFSLSSAVGLFQSVVCVVFLFASNAIAKKLGERGVW
ncbi:MAG: ABC transporter permease subunit [Oscillospiraceae bacterium]|nr:ABC transporter permease subunit [Oscillospiraceae bacterium]